VDGGAAAEAHDQEPRIRGEVPGEEAGARLRSAPFLAHFSSFLSESLQQIKQKRWICLRVQAYTNELENKIALLEQENERLRKLKVKSINQSVTQSESEFHQLS
jgi:hypothetical protein